MRAFTWPKALKRRSKPRVRSYSTFRHTARTSIRSSNCLPSSSPCFARLPHILSSKRRTPSIVYARPSPRNETYLRQFLMRGSPAELSERERQRLGQLLGVLPDDLGAAGNPRLSRLNELCS